MYYCGKRTLNGVFDSLENDYNLSQATDFVMGGLNTFIHTNYVASISLI